MAALTQVPHILVARFGLAWFLLLLGDVAVPLSTLEVRWFVAGSLEETGTGVEEWFRSRPLVDGLPGPLAWDPAPPAWRQDRYLLVPGHDDMGIKWREGWLEIKGRNAVLAIRAIAPGIEGTFERWLKWSYTGEVVERRFLRMFQGGAAQGIVVVEKRRLQRCLRLGPAGDLVEVGRDQPPQRGVNIELAQIRIAGSPGKASWSLAFEAFPDDPDMSEWLTSAVASFLEGCPVLPLAADRSMAYPRWLLGLSSRPHL